MTALMADLLLLPDTNLFVQCKSLSELDWSTLGDNQHIRLIVSRPVQVEIDRQKNKGSDRLGQRARKASSLFREIAESEDNSTLIRECSPRVTILLDNRVKPDASLRDTLDYSERDDQLVGIASSYTQSFTLADVAVLTTDTGPILSAKAVGVRWIAVPSTWLLAPETTDQEKTIQKLQAQVQRLQSLGPVVDVSFFAPDGSPLDKPHFDVSHFRPLASEQIEELMQELQTVFPIATDFGPTGPVERNFINMPNLPHSRREVFTPASDAEKKQYTERDYPDWLGQVRQFFEYLHLILADFDDLPRVHVGLNNKGSQPARDAMVVIRARGRLAIRPPLPTEGDPDDDEEAIRPRRLFDGQLKIPRPPQAPAGRWETSGYIVNRLQEKARAPHSDILNAFDSIDWQPAISALVRDANAFDYKTDRPLQLVSQYELECAQWRHGTPAEILIVEVDAQSDVKVSGVLEVEVHADNLPDVKETKLPMTLNVTLIDIFEKARSLMQA